MTSPAPPPNALSEAVGALQLLAMMRGALARAKRGSAEGRKEAVAEAAALVKELDKRLRALQDALEAAGYACEEEE